MLTTYMLAFAIASLSVIAVEDLKLGRFFSVPVAQSKTIKNKISRNISRLRTSVKLQKNEQKVG